ncbi:MAG: M81 family metallopeptidase [Chloroflexota bacterium]
MSAGRGAPRVLVATLFQESGSFAPGRATRAAFAPAGILEGTELRRARLPGTRELGAAWDALDAAGVTVVPGLFAWAPPGPVVAHDAWEALAAAIVERADRSLDGVYLQLHGSMLTDRLGDPDGELLRRVRARLRADVPIAVSFDHHATITRAIEECASIVTAYRTCPHVDLARTGRQAGELLAAAIAGRIRPVLGVARLAMTAPPDRHDNAFPPFAAIMDACDAAERDAGVLAATMHPSQPWVDVPDLGWSATVTADGDPELARRTAERIALLAWGHRAAFLSGERHPIDAALAIALRGPAPFVVADAGDATNGGSTGGSTELLRAALAHRERRIMLTVTDPVAAGVLRATPVGATARVRIGAGAPGAFDAPVEVEGEVLAHPEGRFTYTHPFSRSLPGTLGEAAVLGIGALRVVVHAEPVGLIDPEAYRGARLDPATAEVLQAKSHVSYRTGFAPLTERSVVAATPGPTTADLASLPWRHRPRPLWPFEEPAGPWRPAAP